MNNIEKEKIRALFRDFLSAHNLNERQVLEAIQTKPKYDIPVDIFKENKLGILEAVVKYYRQNLSLNYNKISKLLNRNKGTIVCTYNNAVKKLGKKFDVDSSLLIPYSILKNRKFGVLESLSVYMKDTLKMKYVEIARALGRDQRTIWTVYNRAKKK